MLIYAHDVDAGQKHEIARNVLRRLKHASAARVLRERYAKKVTFFRVIGTKIAAFERACRAFEFTFGEPYRVHHVDGSLVEIAYPATLIGAKTYNRVRLELRGCVETFAIFFQPTGLQLLFSLPGNVIVNEHYEADAALGAAMRAVHLQLAEARSFHERVRIADAYFRKRIPRVHECCTVDPAVRESFQSRDVFESRSWPATVVVACGSSSGGLSMI